MHRVRHAIVQELGDARPGGCSLHPLLQRAAVAADEAANFAVQALVHLVLRHRRSVAVKPDEPPVVRLHAVANVAVGVPAEAPQAVHVVVHEMAEAKGRSSLPLALPPIRPLAQHHADWLAPIVQPKQP